MAPRPVPLHTACCDSCWNWALAKTEQDAELDSDLEAAAEPADPATLPVGPRSCSCSSACRHQASAPKPPGEARTSATHRPCWGKFDQARTRSERLLFAERVRAETALANDRRLSSRQLRCMLRPFVAASWTVAGVLWGIDHLPDGNAHAFCWSSPADLHNPAAWVAWRLGHWRSGCEHAFAGSIGVGPLSAARGLAQGGRRGPPLN